MTSIYSAIRKVCVEHKAVSAVAGVNATLLFPVVVLAILVVSYISYHKKTVQGTEAGRREILV
jgi:hypothetical protein